MSAVSPTTTAEAPVVTGDPAPPASRRGLTGSLRSERRGVRISAWAVVVVFGGFALLPVYWLLATSLTPRSEVFSYPPRLFPSAVTLDAYRAIFDNAALFGYLKNSIIVSVVTALLSVVVSAYMGYSFSKFRYRGRRSLMYLVLSSQMFPQALLLVTLYSVFSAYGLLNTYAALVLSFTTFTLPLCVWMLKGFFDTIPDEARRGGTRRRGVAAADHPLDRPAARGARSGGGRPVRLRPGLERLHLRPDPRRTGQADAAARPGQHLRRRGSDGVARAMAASLVVSLPVSIAFIALQRFLVGGLTAGAVKG